MRRIYTSILFVIILLMASMVFINENTVSADLESQEMFIGIDYVHPTFLTEDRVNITLDTSLPFNQSQNSSFEFEISTTGEIGLVGDWEEIENITEKDLNTSIFVNCWFKNGRDNWVRFRVRNSTNEWFISEAYNVWVDTEGPRFNLISHSEDEFQLFPRQEIRIKCEDRDSGVNASTVQYRYSTSGKENMTDWMEFPGLENGTEVQVQVEILLSRGDQNYIQVRAGDLAGNNITTSRIYNIKVQTLPTPILVSPIPGGYYQEEIEIIFDATKSYDFDGDRLDHTWYFSTGEEEEILGEVGRILVEMDPGYYNISLKITDRVNNQAWLNFSIIVNETIEPEPEPEQDPFEDVDSDGMPYFFEIEYGFNILVKDGNIDADYDGYTNLQEYENGTNPLDINSHPPPFRDSPEEIEEDTIPIYLTWGMCFLLIGIISIALFAAVFLVLVLRTKDPEG